MASGASHRQARSDRGRQDEEARELIPIRLANLTDKDRSFVESTLADLCAGELGDPDL
jgi:hypothetical protein